MNARVVLTALIVVLSACNLNPIGDWLCSLHGWPKYQGDPNVCQIDLNAGWVPIRMTKILGVTKAEAKEKMVFDAYVDDLDLIFAQFAVACSELPKSNLWDPSLSPEAWTPPSDVEQEPSDEPLPQEPPPDAEIVSVCEEPEPSPSGACAPAPGDDGCTKCGKEACCDAITKCSESAPCVCMAGCIIDSASVPACLVACGAGADAATSEILVCASGTCAEACGWKE